MRAALSDRGVFQPSSDNVGNAGIGLWNTVLWKLIIYLGSD